MKAIGYGRASGYGQESRGYSLEDQRAGIELFCKQNGIELVDFFIETESAATIKARPVFKTALRAVYNDSEVTALVIMNLDRHSRSVFDAEIIKRGLAKRGKRLISVQEQYLTPIHAVDPEFKDYLEAAMQHRMVEAEQERRRIRRRCIRGKKAKEARGGWVGYRPPYEYDVVQGELVPNFERAMIRRHATRLRICFEWTYQRISDYLNGDNRLTNPDGSRGRVFPPPHERETLKKRTRPRQRGTGLWTANSVYKLLNSYRGTQNKGRVKAS